MTRYLSIKTKIYLLTTLLVVFSALITFSLHVHQIWQETEEQQFQQLKSLTELLDSTLEHFDTNSFPIKSEDTHPKNAQKSQKVLFLNQSLQPRIDTLLSAFPDFGAGFYGKSLNSILAFGPGFTSTGLKDIRSSSKARIVYKTRKPYRFSVYSQIRKIIHYPPFF